MPRVKRRQREPCDCLDCTEETSQPAAPAVPQESLACLIFVCFPGEEDTAQELQAINRTVQAGCCGLASLRASMGEPASDSS